jgi:glucose/arabinose dehydrogenase
LNVKDQKRACAAFSVIAIVVGCSAPQRNVPASTAAMPSSALQLPEGYAARLYASGLNAPTALAIGPARDPLTQGSRRLYVAQLNGGEDDGKGQIVAIDEGQKTQEVVFDNLKKPTGLAWFNDALYVVSYQDVLKLTDGDKDGKLDKVDTLVSGVRFNGRSLGHIKVGPSPDPFTGETDPRLYFHSSGGDPNVSGYIYSMRLDGSDRRIIARGLKNAYAFTWSLTSNEMFATDIGDNIAEAPVEEINSIKLGSNYGWPTCPGDRTCAGVEKPIAAFPPHSTPTGIAWWENSLIVTLWGPTDPHVARIALDAQGKPAGASDFARGLKNPIDVIVTNQDTLLILDFSGEIWEVRRPSPMEGTVPPPQPSPTPSDR